jgi:hypothetical protein
VVGTFVLAGAGNALGTPSADLTRMTSSALAWFSPFGWAENTRPFDTDDAWPLASVLATLVLLGGAALLHARRDLGASFVPRAPDAPRHDPVRDASRADRPPEPRAASGGSWRGCSSASCRRRSRASRAGSDRATRP